MHAFQKPLFRKRPQSRGYGYDANGLAGWLFTMAFVILLAATTIPAGLLIQRSEWSLSIPLALIAMMETLAFVWFAKHESERL